MRFSQTWVRVSVYTMSILVVLLAALAAFLFVRHREQTSQMTPLNTKPSNLTSTLVAEKVMAIGGSMAHGWKDPNDNSYIKRAFTALSASTNTNYIYDDRTVVGDSPKSLQKNGTDQLAAWLKQDKPDVVVISWGLLNDFYYKTPLAEFKQSIHDEISDALKAHTVVLVVSPPVVQALATYDHSQAETFIKAEFDVANSFHSPNVHNLNLFSQMESYLAAHGQTFVDYKGDSWHPDEAGHVLAGEILYNEIMYTLGPDPIAYK